MNIENINKTIAIMERAKERDSVYMETFQGMSDGDEVVYTEADMHACGNKACLAGHIAVSPEWLSEPGNSADECGAPETRTFGTNVSLSITDWWGLNPKEDTDLTIDYFIYGNRVNSINIYGIPWREIKAEHVIRELTLLRDLGEAEYCKLRGISI